MSRRQALEAAAVDAAARLASLRLHSGQPQAAAEAARTGLSLDRYRDDLWKLLIEAADRCGFHAEAGQARRTYAAILDRCPACSTLGNPRAPRPLLSPGHRRELTGIQCPLRGQKTMQMVR